MQVAGGETRGKEIPVPTYASMQTAVVPMLTQDKVLKMKLKDSAFTSKSIVMIKRLRK